MTHLRTRVQLLIKHTCFYEHDSNHLDANAVQLSTCITP